MATRIPLFQKQKEALGNIGFDTLLSFASASLGTLFGAMSRDQEYASNRAGPRASPPPDSIIRSYWAGRFGNPESQNAKGMLTDLLLEHGVARGPSEGLFRSDFLDRRGMAWEQHIRMTRPFLPLDWYVKAYRFGEFGPENDKLTLGKDWLQAALNRDGLYDKWQQNMVEWLPETLSIQEIFALWSAGIIGPMDVDRLLKVAGQVDDKQRQWLMNLFEVPNLQEVFVLRNRGLIKDAEMLDYFGRLGFRRNEEKFLLSNLRFEIPGPSDLVRFSVRHVFEPSVAEHYGFDQELSSSFVDWMNKQGFGQEFSITDPFNHRDYPMTWPKAHWLAHWVWPAPTQAYTMLHRLRPTGGENGGPRVSRELTFDMNDLNNLLRGNDYPPYWRPFLAAISFRMIEAEQVARCWQTGIFDDNETVERYQDIGYDYNNANVLLRLQKNEQLWQRIQKSISRLRFKTLSGYKTGILSRDESGEILYRLALPNLETYLDYARKPLPERIAIAREDSVTQMVLNTIDTDLAVSLAGKAIAAIHKAYLHLEIDEQTALNSLLTIGVVQNRADNYIKNWKWEFYGRGKTLAVGQILKTVVRGLMLPQVAVQRLVLLGYSQVDAFALVNMANEDRLNYVTKAANALARSKAAQQKAIASQVKLLQKELRDNQSKLAKSASRAKLIKFYTKNLIPLSEFRLRLSLLGVSQEDIEHEVQLADAAKQRKSSSKKAVATSP